MNAHGSFFFHGVVNQPKITTINAMLINHLRNVPRDSIAGREIKNNMYIHYPVASDPRLGCSRIPWMCTFQVYSSLRLQVDWISSCLAGGQVSASHDSTWARLGRDPQYSSFFCMVHWAQLHTWRIGHYRCTPDFPTVRHKSLEHGDCWHWENFFLHWWS